MIARSSHMQITKERLNKIIKEEKGRERAAIT